MTRHRLSPLALLLSLAIPLAAATVRVGDWTCDASPSAIAIRFRDQPVVRNISFSAFAHDYSRMRFSLDQNQTQTTAANAITVAATTPEGSATLTVTLSPTQADIALKADVKAGGPAEFGLLIPEQALRIDAERHFLKAGDSFVDLDSDPFSQLAANRLACDLIPHRLTITNHDESHSFVLQDKRASFNRCVRLITTLNGEQRIRADLRLTLAAETFTPEAVAIRRQTLATPRNPKFPVAFDNPGFEDGANGWDHFPSNAAIVSDVTHSGKRAARLTVNDPMTESVYITRKIPVRGGAFYQASVFLKTLDVTAAPGKRSSVGAGLIVEWSDKDGKWFDSGAYACNVYGTRDWQKQVCRSLRAPDNAGYAEVFLALRDKGTAWFDDLTLTRIESSVDKLTPKPGATLDTNTPLFTWIPMRGADSYTLQLSQNRDFPAGETLTIPDITEPQLQLTTPLRPGRWHWKLLAKGSDDARPWSFTQQATVDRDCLPPTILFEAHRILDGQQSLDIAIADTRDSALQLTVDDNGTPVPVGAPRLLRDQPQPGHLTAVFPVRPAHGWKPGLHTLTLTATDQAGNSASKTAWLLNAPKPPNPVTIDENGRYNLNGKPFFPFGIYEVTRNDDMRMLRRLGFDAIHTYRWEGSRDDNACRAFLERCWNADGLRAFIGFDRRAICEAKLDVIAQRVGALADHPGLFVWYLFDEPEIPTQYVSPALLTRFANLIRALDPYHAVVMTTWGKGMNRYRQTWDTHWTQAYYTPDAIVRQLDEHRQLLLNQSPITLLVHCFDNKQTATFRTTGKYDPDAFQPDRDWMRCAAFLGLTEHANGLWWWWFARDNRQFLNAIRVPQAWQAFADLIRELKGLQRFLDAPFGRHGRVKANRQTIAWATRTAGPETLLVIANTGTETVTVNLDQETGIPLGPLTLTRYQVVTRIVRQ